MHKKLFSVLMMGASLTTAHVGANDTTSSASFTLAPLVTDTTLTGIRTMDLETTSIESVIKAYNEDPEIQQFKNLSDQEQISSLIGDSLSTHLANIKAHGMERSEEYIASYAMYLAMHRFLINNFGDLVVRYFDVLSDKTQNNDQVMAAFGAKISQEFTDAQEPFAPEAKELVRSKLEALQQAQ